MYINMEESESKICIIIVLRWNTGLSKSVYIL